MDESSLFQIYNSQPLLVDAVNSRLGEVQVLMVRLVELGYKPLIQVPEQIPAPGASDSSGPEYDPKTGLSAPRSDGAVRSKMWDEAIAQGLASSDPNVKRWANENVLRPWVFVQDTLEVPGVSAAQRTNIGTNCALARFSTAMAGGDVSRKGFASQAYLWFKTPGGSLKQGELIKDAFAVRDDLISHDTGLPVSRGFRAGDLKALAESSLNRFLLTNGALPNPYLGAR